MLAIDKNENTYKNKLDALYKIKMLKKADTVLLVITVILSFLLIPDFFLLKENFWPFVILKGITLLLIFFTKKLISKFEGKFLWWFHLSIMLFNVFCLTILTTQNDFLRIIYLNVIAVFFMVFNSFIVWDNRNSLLQVVLLIFLFLFYIQAGFIKQEQFFVENGGYALLSFIVATSFISKIKKSEFELKASETYQQQKLIKNLRNELEEKKLEIKNLTRVNKKAQRKYNSFFEEFNKRIREINNLSLILNNKYSNTIAKNMKQKITEIGILSTELVTKNKLFLVPSVSENKSKENETYNLNSEEVDLKIVYNNCIQKLHQSIEAKNLLLEEKISNSAMMIKADKNGMELVIQNMLQFAIQYSQYNNSIFIKISKNQFNCFFEIFSNKSNAGYNEIEHILKSEPQQKYQNKIVELDLSKKLTEAMSGYFNYASSKKMGFELVTQFKSA